MRENVMEKDQEKYTIYSRLNVPQKHFIYLLLTLYIVCALYLLNMLNMLGPLWK